MKLAKARILTLSLLLAALAIAVAAQFLTAEGSAEYTLSLAAVLVLFAAGVGIAVIWGRCPNCGKRLFVNFLRLSRCPGCGRPIDPDGSFRAGGRRGDRRH